MLWDFSPASPQPAGTPVTIKVNAVSDPPTPRKLYQFQIKHDGEWVTVQPYSENDTLVWTPEAEGQYWIGFMAKAADSPRDYDNSRVIAYQVTEPAPDMEAVLLRKSIKNITAELSQSRKQLVAMTSALAQARMQISQLEGELKGMQLQQKRDVDAAQKERASIARSLDQLVRNAEVAQKEHFTIVRSLDQLARNAEVAQKEHLGIARGLDQQTRNAETAQKERFDIEHKIDRRMDELKAVMAAQAASIERLRADFERYRSKWWWQRQ